MDKPIILLKGKYSEETLAELKKKNRVWKTIDIYKNQLGEVFQITHPRLLYSSDYDKEKENFVKAKLGKNPSLKGNWIYFPWSGFLIHTVGQKDYLTLRTNRNRNLITKKEQEKLYDFCVGIAGLSIGNMIAVSLAYQGFSTFKLAELDTLETTNLNRIRTGIGSLGMRKIDITAQQIYEIDPHAKLYLFNRGLKKNNFKN
ncbi:MAG: UBA/THIF-type NAD/FAD binding protein, partial [Microgenomates group bacterium GW2011_GWC1_37_8]